MVKNLQDITYRGRSISWGLILGTRRYGWMLKRTVNPLWAKNETTGDFISVPQFKSNETKVYIPYNKLKAGDVWIVQDGIGKREKWHIVDVCKTAIEYTVEPIEVVAKTRRDYKVKAYEPEPLTLEPAPELAADCPFDVEENDGETLERMLMIDKLRDQGFNHAALCELPEPDLNALFAQFGGVK